jgi:hypothetical protein
VRWLCWIVLVASLGSGCTSRCARVETARRRLASHPVGEDRGADVRVRLPLERANELLAELLAEEPLRAPIDLPDLGPIALAVPGALSAVALQVRLRPAEDGKVRFAFVLEIRDGQEAVTTLEGMAEVQPKLQRSDGAAELVIQLGLENLLAVEPQLGADAPAAMARAVQRWIPSAVRGKVPAPLLDLAARRLSTYLGGAAFAGLRRTLLPRLGELTRLRLRLPEVPVADAQVRSVTAPREALVIEVLTDLPVRRGLTAPTDSSPEITVSLSGSAIAELSNWSIDHGLAPRWYSRDLSPAAGGEFRPRFDYVAEDLAHPFKVHAIQERGGCSYFRVGVQASVALEGESLTVTALDRVLEEAIASTVIEIAARVKYWLLGSLDQSKRVAAHTRLTIGARVLETRVVSAALTTDQLTLGLQFQVAPRR